MHFVFSFAFPHLWQKGWVILKQKQEEIVLVQFVKCALSQQGVVMLGLNIMRKLARLSEKHTSLLNSSYVAVL